MASAKHPAAASAQLPQAVVGNGRTAQVIALDKERIVKRYRSSFPAHAVRAEFAASDWVYRQGLSVPRVFELLEEEAGLAIVFQRIQGPTLMKRILVPGFQKRGARLLASLQAEMNRIPVDESAPFRSMKNALTASIREAPLLTETDKERIIRYTEALPEETRLCHGDFHPDNVLLGAQPCIIDWATAVSGSPAGDAARTVLMLQYGSLPDGTPQWINTVIGLVRKRLTRTYLEHYLKLSGISRRELEQWMLPVAAARLIEWLPQQEKAQLTGLVRTRLKEMEAAGG
jgi:aminoglycoside phosphotransferase (APT) family kinase protein